MVRAVLAVLVVLVARAVPEAPAVLEVPVVRNRSAGGRVRRGLTFYCRFLSQLGAGGDVEAATPSGGFQFIGNNSSMRSRGVV